MRFIRATKWLAATGGVALLAGLSGCGESVVVAPAPHPEAPACARVMLNMPDKMGGAKSRTTSSQATAAWGTPSAAIFKCGMKEPAATTDPCVNVSGVDWISTQQDKKTWRFVTFGRKPAAEVLVDPSKLSGATVLSTLGDAIKQLPKSGHKCVAAEDLDKNGAPESANPKSAGAPSAGPTDGAGR